MAPEHIVVTGGSGGLGSAMVQALLERFPNARITATYHHNRPPAGQPRLNWQPLDLRDPEAIMAFAEKFESLDWLLNCAGLLHNAAHGPEKTIRHLDSEFFMQNISVNTLPTLLLAQAFHQPLRCSRRPLLATISARVGSIADNRLGGWYSYRVSKAALNMALKTLSIEWRYSHPQGCVAALHPGTNDTSLSKPFQRGVPPENLFRPQATARRLVELLAGLGPGDSGSFLAWDGQQLPW